MTSRKAVALFIIVMIGFIAGRLAMRGLGNMLLGGTMFGGNFL